VAALGTVLATVYRSHLDLTGLPASAATAVKQSVAGGVAAAKTSGSGALLDSVRLAYVHGLDVMLWVCAGIAIASAVLALLFLPGWAPAPEETPSAAGAEPGPADDTIGADPGPATSALDKSRMTT
jgi:MFS transporter, DHA2 family, multidrug resistance protein